jgi:hypothetical protein
MAQFPQSIEIKLGLTLPLTPSDSERQEVTFYEVGDRNKQNNTPACLLPVIELLSTPQDDPCY